MSENTPATASDTGREPDERAASEEIRLLRAALRTEREHIRELGSTVTELRAERDVLNQRLVDSWRHIHKMRSSFSWRITTPLRVWKMLLR